MKKTKRTISVDADLWIETQARARQLRLSASWIAEEALREYLKPLKRRRKESQCRSACG